MAYLDYSLIVIFFVGLFILVILMARSPSAKPATSKNVSAAQTATAPQENKLAYGFLASLFILFLVLTFLNERRHPVTARAG